jgi:hypothetical protein
MKKYEDIQTLDLVTDSAGDKDEIDWLCPMTDICQKIAATNEQWELWKASADNEESIWILYFPEIGRAGIAWGADANWTDAESVEDALERYFGVDGKTMAG